VKRFLAIAMFALAAAAAEPTPPGWLGMGVTYHTKTAADGSIRGWLFIRNLEPNGPAARAGLHVQDVIDLIDDKPLAFRDDVTVLRMLSSVRPHQQVRLRVLHEGVANVRVVVAAELPERARRAWQANFELAKKQQRKP